MHLATRHVIHTYLYFKHIKLYVQYICFIQFKLYLLVYSIRAPFKESHCSCHERFSHGIEMQSQKFNDILPKDSKLEQKVRKRL